MKEQRREESSKNGANLRQVYTKWNSNKNYDGSEKKVTVHNVVPWWCYVSEHNSKLRTINKPWMCESHFGPPLTKKVICEWRRQEEELKVREKWRVFSHTYHKMACPVSGSDKMHQRQRLKMWIRFFSLNFHSKI